MRSSSTMTSLFVLLGIICLNIGLIKPDHTVCSDYLVSGLYGVDDQAMSASSEHGGSSHGAQCARLHNDDDYYTTGRISSWSAGILDLNQYIQVELPRETVVDAILIQGRDFVTPQWVGTFYLSYSMDGTSWTTVTSNNGEPKLFYGNNDMVTVVVNRLDPGITTKYVKINPRSWNSHISLRFDVSGCYTVKQREGNFASFRRLPVPPPSMLHQHIIHEAQSTTFPTCSSVCKNRSNCKTFTFDMNQKTCRCFEAVVRSPNSQFIDTQTPYFIKNALDPGLGFRPILGDTCVYKYKVNERAADQSEALVLCTSYQSRLFRVDSVSNMEYLQTTLGRNKIIWSEQKHFFVSGKYEDGEWKYSDEPEVINDDLWSPENPNSTRGQCVKLTQTGLASVECSDRLFSICGAF